MGFYCGRNGQDLRVVVEWSFLLQVFERQPLVLTQVLRWRGWEEWTLLSLLSKNLVCLMLSLEHYWLFLSVVFLINCSLKARYLFCNWKYRLAFLSSQRSFRECTSSTLPSISCIAGRSETGERVCCFRFFRSSWGILFWNPASLKPSSQGRTFDVCYNYLG